MTIGFVLNGKEVSVQTDEQTRLVDVLRSDFRLHGTKAGCCCGNCGACSIILNGEVVKSCLVPVFKIRDHEVTTIEAFSQTGKYQDIISAFREAGVESCGFCDTGKILSAEALLGRNPKPLKDEILAAYSGIRCRCTDPETLVRGVISAGEYRRRRLYGRSA